MLKAAGPITLVALENDFRRLKASPGGVSESFLYQLLEFMRTTDFEVDDNIRAHELLVDAYRELGERVSEREAFVRHLGLVEEGYGRERAADKVKARADRKFFANLDYLDASTYYRILLDRYADLPQAQYAMYMFGVYYARVGAGDDAMAVYKTLVGNFPRSEWSKRARQNHAMALSRAGRDADAIGVLTAFARDYPSDEDQAYAHFYRGIYHYKRGATDISAAVSEFQALVREYPEHRFAASALEMIETIAELSEKKQSKGRGPGS